jgi:hypothetical protein
MTPGPIATSLVGYLAEVLRGKRCILKVINFSNLARQDVI